MKLNHSHGERLTTQLAAVKKEPLRYLGVGAAGRGDVDFTGRLRTDRSSFFVKFGPAVRSSAHHAEARALGELAMRGSVKVPAVSLTCCFAGVSFLVLEWLDLEPRTVQADIALGRHLAKLHQCTAVRYGWECDNWIGTTPQCNSREVDWPTFWMTHRLHYQLLLLGDPKCLALGEELNQQIKFFFPPGEPVKPSLLHGDLWSGNAAQINSQPVIYDPAVYYGDRETDLAMMRLFGGFSESCFAAYEEILPCLPGRDDRQPLYQLYHILNHANLFGGGYLKQAHSVLRELVDRSSNSLR